MMYLWAQCLTRWYWVQTDGHLITHSHVLHVFHTIHERPLWKTSNETWSIKMAKNGHLLLSTRHTCAAASDVLLTPRPPVMTDRRTAAADCVTASHRRHFHDVLYSFFDAVDNFNLQCKHQQIIKMSSNEPTCFYINKDYVTYLNTNIMLSTIYQLTSAIYQLTNLWNTGILNMLLQSLSTDYYRYNMVK